MIDDIAEELINYVWDHGQGPTGYAQSMRKIKTELARYAVAALMDSKIALESEKVLVNENKRSSL